MIELNSRQTEALNRVIEYLWPDERRDWQLKFLDKDSDSSGHIYRELEILDGALTSIDPDRVLFLAREKK